MRVGTIKQVKAWVLGYFNADPSRLFDGCSNTKRVYEATNGPVEYRKFAVGYEQAERSYKRG